MLTHEYGDSLFEFLDDKKNPQNLIKTHLSVLFKNAVKNPQTSLWKILLDDLLSAVRRQTKAKLVDGRNSVGIALGRENLAHVSTVERKLGLLVDTVAKETQFDFSEAQVAHVCAADSMAALAFSTSRCGYARARGLSCLDGLGPTIGLAIAVVRLNDWVPEVRFEAIRCILRLIQNNGGPNGGLANDIAGIMNLLLENRRFSRISRPELSAIQSLIEYPGVKEALLRSFIYGESDISKNECLKAVIKTGTFVEILPDVATKSTCAYRRLLACRAIFSSAPPSLDEYGVEAPPFDLTPQRSKIIKSALLDKSANVVLAALDYVLSSKDYQKLDKYTISHLSKRHEPSLQIRIGSLIDILGN
ncbi:hypothetical protein ASD8599_03281 [Ascidiaceihabitans donghaensis]|uniref:Uncharacterized protein n=1 Tax=Ascidiaceihabitans donghaensis TaxID=1510460 RepID=A0A2R8BHP3_9RHOB|nr:hypothetical protein [Ascidiaceihabitans donghaensis]SPH22538.1 hypothetical protein ASD8599_03281 [Ascidiaceihabitans donghaensis]